MTKEEIKKIRKDCKENVSSPGKFEGEAIYSPYFRETILGGCQDEEFSFHDGCYDAIIVTEDDRKIFPELASVYGVICNETETGFFLCHGFNQDDYQEEIENLQTQEEEEENEED